MNQYVRKQIMMKMTKGKKGESLLFQSDNSKSWGNYNIGNKNMYGNFQFKPGNGFYRKCYYGNQVSISVTISLIIDKQKKKKSTISKENKNIGL